jgi:prepilin-type N-terminal cleavage/methylation domain-containing protein
MNRPHTSRGFTLIEILVSTTIFATVLTMMLVLFNYTLKIDRKTETLRQATQGARNFTEFLVKEIRNGRIDYGPPPAGLPPVAPCTGVYNNGPTGDTALGIVNVSDEQECIYLSGNNLMITKQVGTTSYPAQRLNPVGVNIVSAKFYVRPAGNGVNPYNTTSPPRIQPFVTMLIEFQVQLSPNDAAVTIPYQTSVSTDLYDVPD